LIQDSILSNQVLMEVMASLTPDQRETVQAAFTILAQAARRVQISEKGKGINHA
jgi:hypothetical protein